MDYLVKDIDVFVNLFTEEMTKNENPKPEYHRYRSFDFCYSHFYNSKTNNQIDIERSCYVLWSYLASWGMLRGSSFLLQKNPAYLSDLVEYIYRQDKSVWNIDIDNYPENYDKIITLYNDVKENILKGKNHRHLVLVTKIMLGIFANIPAYDTYFCKTFKEISSNNFSFVDKATLGIIHEFYLKNQEIIDKLQQESIVFNFYEQDTKLKYSKAKIIDMYGFSRNFPRKIAKI